MRALGLDIADTHLDFAEAMPIQAVFSFVCLQDTPPQRGREEWSDKQMHRAHTARTSIRSISFIKK